MFNYQLKDFIVMKLRNRKRFIISGLVSRYKRWKRVNKDARYGFIQMRKHRCFVWYPVDYKN